MPFHLNVGSNARVLSARPLQRSHSNHQRPRPMRNSSTGNTNQSQELLKRQYSNDGAYIHRHTLSSAVGQRSSDRHKTRQTRQTNRRAIHRLCHKCSEDHNEPDEPTNVRLIGGVCPPSGWTVAWKTAQTVRPLTY